MKNIQKQLLINAINTILPKLIIEWNTKKLPQFEVLFEESFVIYFKGRQTQEKTKLVAPVLDKIFSRLMAELLPTFQVDEGKGRDYNFGGIPLESKITLSPTDNCIWTGNGYAKTPWHILMKFQIDEDGRMTKMFAMLADLSICVTKWSKTDERGNFSNLTFLTDDIDKIHIIRGDIRCNRINKSGMHGKLLKTIRTILI